MNPHLQLVPAPEATPDAAAHVAPPTDAAWMAARELGATQRLLGQILSTRSPLDFAARLTCLLVRDSGMRVAALWYDHGSHQQCVGAAPLFVERCAEAVNASLRRRFERWPGASTTMLQVLPTAPPRDRTPPRDLDLIDIELRAEGRLIGVLLFAPGEREEDGGPGGQYQRMARLAPILTAALDASLRLARAERASVTDDLTGLANRRGFRAALDGETARALRYSRALALLTIDVDEFKAINDTAGHAEGDRVLREVAAALRRTVRACDTVARVGGDEFAVLLPETTTAGARRAAQRLARAVSTVRALGKPISVSAGASSVAAATAEGADMIEAADRALYAAKRARRGGAAPAVLAARAG